MASSSLFIEDRQASLDATSEPPALFDGTTRLYMSYSSPFAQRVWITRNVKGLQEKIKLVPIDLRNRPTWYKEKVNPANQVPALEHNGKIMRESLDVMKYIDSNFDGLSLYPKDPAKREFGEELMKYCDTTFIETLFASFNGNPAKETESVFSHLENALNEFNDGPFFLGNLSLVDIAFIPWIERVQVFLNDVFKYDITIGRPKLAAWIKEMNNMVAYKQTKDNPKQYIEYFKKRFMGRVAQCLKYENRVISKL